MTTALAARPDTNALIVAVCDAVASPHTKRAYAGHLTRFLAWCNGDGLNRDTVHAYRSHLEAAGRGQASINQALCAIKKLASEAHKRGAISDLAWFGVSDTRGSPQRGARAGNWLTPEQAQRLTAAGDDSLMGLRDRAIVGVLIGCALRRAELASLTVDHIQFREDRPVIVDLVGKGGRVRSVPMPLPAYERVKSWLEAAGIVQGAVFRSFGARGDVCSRPMGGKAVCGAVTRITRLSSVFVAPHDLRRTCARLMYKGGRDLNQIRLILGHSSMDTTLLYVGWETAEIADAANDGLPVW